MITEKRRGRGLANYIYVMKPELSDEQAIEKIEDLRSVETTHQEFSELENQPKNRGDMSDLHIKECKNDISECDNFTHQDMSNLPTSKRKSLVI